jgi:hypothetical protein
MYRSIHYAPPRSVINAMRPDRILKRPFTFALFVPNYHLLLPMADQHRMLARLDLSQDHQIDNHNMKLLPSHSKLRLIQLTLKIQFGFAKRFAGSDNVIHY